MPRGKKAKRASRRPTGGDRIGALPDGVLHHVLSFLPAQQAVRTCLLARRWRHLWKSATGLRIGEHNINLRSVKENQGFLDHLLLLRDSAPLDTCVLMFREGNKNMEDEDVARMNLWFRHALLRKARFLQLHVLYGKNDRWLVPIDDLPLVSRHLTRLHLYGIRLNDSFLNFSSCPALEHLVFRLCAFECAKISSNSVKLLSITNCTFSETLRVRIDTPSLVSLRLDDLSDRTPVLERMPSLVDAFVRIVDYTNDVCSDSDTGDCDREGCVPCYGIKDNNSVLLQGLSEAKTMVLINEHDSFIFERDLKWCPTFTKLKTLSLNEYWCERDDFHMLACILEHSPILEKLIFQFDYQGQKSKIKGVFNQMERSAGILEHLQMVEVQCVMVDDTVVKVLNYLSTFKIYFSFEEMEH
ncbi:MEIOTIC F-BOX protein MOF-like [Oryza brachyantha]|uniref:F-box domain-containing protein n=1 Tax=Oryza brachyantha TaxID=4533 RepID=J3N6P4_ORYBR|nr:MEIOTIC F-BOX protein MOF-like [Oryza brachyantha]